MRTVAGPWRASRQWHKAHAIACLLVCASWSVAGSPVAKKVARADAARELLANGGLERTNNRQFEGWLPYDKGYQIDEDGRQGGKCAVCDNPDGQKRMGLSQTLRLDRRTARPLVVSGWSKAEAVPGSANLDYSIYVDLEYQDGTSLWAQVASFTAGTHDWEYQQVRIYPEKPVKTLSVNALFRERKGKVWFDDVSLKELGGETDCVIFDGACVSLPAQERTFAEATACLQVRDVGSDSDFIRISLDATATGVIQIPELKLSIESERQKASKSCDRTAVTVKDLSGQDRAITLYYCVPLDAKGWRWFDNVRQSRVIDPPFEYANVYRPGVGATGRTSRYPFACVAGSSQARSLLVTQPAVCHLGYHAGTRELYAAFDLGLSSAAKQPGCATVTICDARTDPEWGMRDTARLFYELLPQYFDAGRLPARQGNWMAFQAISSVQQPEDFGFAVHEGNNDVRWDNDHEIMPFVYVEPMTFWSPLPKQTPRTYAAVMDHLKAIQNDPKSPNHGIARAVDVSCVYDRDGRYHVDILNTPWCDGAVFGNSPDPDVPEREGFVNLAHHHVAELDRALKSAETQGGLAGVYLDSLEGWGTLLNYRREHFAAADLPLTFDASSHRPVILNAFATQEWTQFIADRLHARGKLLMANAVPNEYPFLALPCDLLGTETNWQRDGRFSPPPPDYLYIKRTMSWKKPYMFLMNTHFETWTAEMTERYMQLCLFYGMFPGFFSENASTNCYFQNPAWYNRDRALFRRYLPLIQQVAQAGWEPLTLARADCEEVWVERWGSSMSKRMFLTVMNTAEQARRTTIRLDPSLAPRGNAHLLVTSRPADASSRLELDLPPGSVEVIEWGN